MSARLIRSPVVVSAEPPKLIVVMIYLVVALAYFLDLPLLLLYEPVQGPKVQLLGIIVLNRLDERCQRFEVLCC